MSTSGRKYTGSSSSSVNVTFNFYGLEDNTGYYIKAIGNTVDGTYLDTGYINFTASYITPESFNVFLVQNNCDDGYINYYSLAYVAYGDSNPSPPIYYNLDDSIGVNLTSSNSWVRWDSTNSNFIIPKNFTLKAWVLNPNLNSNLITLSNGEHSIRIWYGHYPFDNTKVIVSLVEDDSKYFVYSNLIPIPEVNQELCIQIRSVNGLFDVVLGVV